MDITTIFFILVFIGLILIVSSIFVDRKKFKDVDFKKISNFIDKQNDLIKSIDDVDDAIEQLNGISKHIFKEQEDKYEELLYLYKFIDEKKQELSELYDKIILLKDTNTRNNINSNAFYSNNTQNKKPKKALTHNEKHLEIINLYNQGKTISEIAKTLNIGKGEVSLILELKNRGE